MVELKNVCLSFNKTPVLKDFSISVNKGEHVVIMGPSGSGKTTILKLIAGQIKPQKGELRVTTDKISYMFQEPRLLPWLSAAENVNLVLGDTAETMPEAIKWLQILGLGEDTDKHPSELSGGMQQRVALARALAYNGDLLLLDEPLSALDETLADELLHLIKEYAANKTVIFVTHSTLQAKKFADTIYVIKKQTS